MTTRKAPRDFRRVHSDLEDPPVYEGAFLMAMAQVRELETALIVYSKGLDAAARDAEEIAKQNKRARRARRSDPEHVFRDSLEIFYEEESEKERFLWAQQRSEFAKQQKAAGSPYLFNLGTIRIWGILEAAVDDGVAELIQSRPSLWDEKVFEKLDVPFRDFAKATPTERAVLVLRALKDRVGATKQNGVDRFESLLKVIGLAGPYDKEIEKVVRELSAVRHILVHRDGLVDDRFLRQCPWKRATRGERLSMDHKQFHRYAQAAEWLILEYYRRLRMLDGKPEDEDRIRTQIALAGLLVGTFSTRKTWPPERKHTS